MIVGRQITRQGGGVDVVLDEVEDSGCRAQRAHLGVGLIEQRHRIDDADIGDLDLQVLAVWGDPSRQLGQRRASGGGVAEAPAEVAHHRIADYAAGVSSRTPWSERDAQTPADAAEERLLLGLRTVEGVAMTDLKALDLTARVKGLVEDGFLAVADGRVAATATGRPVLDAVLKALLT